MLFLLVGFCSCAVQAETISQRHINDYAAAIEKCRITLLESTRLRGEKEKLPNYIDRILSPLPRENDAEYHARIAGYVKALDDAVSALSGLRAVPDLTHNDAANRELWRRAVKDIGYLPRRMLHVQSAWSTVKTHTDPASSRKLASEILETIQLMFDCQTRLRDALP